MKTTLLKTIVMLTVGVIGLVGVGYSQAPEAPAASSKVLAISRPGPALDPQKIQALMPDEVRATVDLYLKGTIEQWFFRQDQGGVVFLLSSRTVDGAKAALAGLPLVKTKMLEFDFIPVGPLMPLRALLSPPKGQL
jgi:hypothetical protein